MKYSLTMKFAAVAVLAAGMAMAQAPAPNQPPRRAAVRQHMMQALNLTDAQKQQAQAIFQQTRQTAQPLRQQLQANRKAMAQAIQSDDEAGIRQLAGTQTTLRSQLLANRNVAMAQFYKILTPEQRAKADQMIQAIRQRIQQFRARRSNG